MKIKNLYPISFLAITIFLSSMALLQTPNLQDLDPPQTNQSDENFQLKSDRYHQGMITIKLKKGLPELDRIEGQVLTGIKSLDEKFSRYEVSLLKNRVGFNRNMHKDGMPELWRIYTIHFPEKHDVMRLAREFSKDPNVEYAEPVFRSRLCEIPDDELYDQLWHLPKIMAPEAWDIHKGQNGPEVVIGIVDDAVDWRHEDLVSNQWENLGEDADGDGHVIEFNGSEWVFDPGDENNIDDDGNGKIDDFVGWDFMNENEEEDNDPTPEIPTIDHGTHCIGIANAVTDNMIDVASIAWNVKFVGAKLCNDDDLYLDHDPYEPLVYLAELGADILTNSWTSGGFSQADMEICEYVQGLGGIIVAAAGNDNEPTPNYPASYPGVISVAASTQWDYKASFSNYGPGIDICSPGVSILSLKPNNSTQLMSGTSMATPLAAGMMALLKSYFSTASNEEIIIQALGTADDIDTINPYNANELGYGRINAYRALSETNVTTQEELKLYYIDNTLKDADSNGIFSPGEIITMGFSMMNFAVGMAPVDVTFTLSTTSPHINLVNHTTVFSVPSDEIFTTEDAFSFEINSSLDSTCLISLQLAASAGIPIPLDSIWSMEVLVNQQGVIVFNGTGSGNSYSGEYIADFLSNQWVDVFYTEAFPASFNGFSTAFLSLGNYGQSLSNGTYFSPEQSVILADYLINGGNMYVDCGSFFGLMEYGEYNNYEEMLQLFSLDTVITPMTSNNIDSLWGIDGSLAEGLVFNGSSQSPNWYIDIMVPGANGHAMLEESDYGIVAAQGEGDYGQRTVCLSYSIAHLDEASPGDRDLLLARIAEYFGLLAVGTPESPQQEEVITLELYPNPVISELTAKISVAAYDPASLSILDLQGRILQHIEIEAVSSGTTYVHPCVADLPAGVYIAQLRCGTHVVCKKMIKH